jgi:hypothetical protein
MYRTVTYVERYRHTIFLVQLCHGYASAYPWFLFALMKTY